MLDPPRDNVSCYDICSHRLNLRADDEACLFIAAGCDFLACALVAPETVPPAAVWIDWPEGAAHSDGWRAAVPAGALAAGSAVTAVERAGRWGGMQVVVVVRRGAILDAVDALPVGTADWPDAPGGQRDDPAERRDGPDALQDGPDARRGDPAGCREDLCREDLADCPAGQAERRDGRVAYPDGRDGRRADGRTPGRSGRMPGRLGPPGRHAPGGGLMGRTGGRQPGPGGRTHT